MPSMSRAPVFSFRCGTPDARRIRPTRAGSYPLRLPRYARSNTRLFATRTATSPKPNWSYRVRSSSARFRALSSSSAAAPCLRKKRASMESNSTGSTDTRAVPAGWDELSHRRVWRFDRTPRAIPVRDARCRHLSVGPPTVSLFAYHPAARTARCPTAMRMPRSAMSPSV